MAEFYSYKGLHTSGTFKLDSDTATAIANDPRQIVGRVVTLTESYVVGYGADGDEPLGVVEQVDKENTNSNNYVVTVGWGRTFEDIPASGSETFGDYLVGAGDGTVKASSSVHTNCFALGVDSTAKTVTIKIV